ncbi:YoaP domain-containing protein [Acidobacteriota bacterium]
MENIKIINTDAVTIRKYAMCGYKNIRQEGYKKKIEWLEQRFSEGMKYKVLFSEKDGAVGAIEYIPGEYTWRTVNAGGYMVIHCIYIMTRKYKEKGYGVQMLEECLRDAQKENMNGAAVVTRQGTWMAGKELFVKEGFEVVDEAPPDFELLVKKIKPDAPIPGFMEDLPGRAAKYDTGLTIFRSGQCPYTVKAVKEIGEAAGENYGIYPEIIEFKSSRQAREISFCAFGTFCMVYNGKLIANHPVSKTRFNNIMNKILT